VKIISKFRDYYDSAQMYGQGDNTLIYLRDQAEGENPLNVSDDIASFLCRYTHELNDAPRVMFKGQAYRIFLYDLTLVFCGKVYPRACAEVYADVPPACSQQHVLTVWGERVDLVEGEARAKMGFPPRPVPKWKIFDDPRDEAKFQENLARANALPWADIHQEYGAPVLSFVKKETYNGGRWSRKTMVQRNPVLADAHFAAIMPPTTCYQEIEMYLGGILSRPTKPMVQLTDKDLIKKAGFDVVTSFRRPKEKK
jgi:hypothetical protein